MSYILDALKKSETERARQHAPGFADLPAGGRRRGGSRWALAFGVLLAVNAVVVAALVLRPAPPGPVAVDEVREQPVASGAPVATEAAAANPVAAAAGSAAIAGSADDSVAVRPVADPPPARVASPAEAATTVASEASPPERSSTPARTAETTPRAAATPTLLELQARGRLSLPELHLDIHVYSESPAERFVFINMSKYREGSELAEGPRIRTIAPDGVVLEHRGTVFLLPRE